MLRRTIGRAVRRAGIGLHSGRACAVTLAPARLGEGVVFLTAAGPVPADVEHAEAGAGATVLVAGDGRVSTPEHLLAALSALRVTDVTLELEGEEVPALDGSAAGWVEAIDEAGRVEFPTFFVMARERVFRQTIVVEGHGGRAVFEPGASLLTVAIDYGAGGPAGALSVALTEQAFRDEVCWARTFVREADIERLRAAGRGRGATEENTVVWPGASLRAPDEPVRHKALDAWGDLALLGPFLARVEVTRGSHALHLALVRAAHAALTAAHDHSR
jgi:UDP-3-O-[3-hydroxymyristoyl] N-acetylglucosamine deacetylase